MLAGQGDGGAEPPVARELPAEPDDPARAKKAEQIVAACFLLAMLAGFGFLVAYSIIGVGLPHRGRCTPTWPSAACCPSCSCCSASAPRSGSGT